MRSSPPAALMFAMAGIAPSTRRGPDLFQVPRFGQFHDAHGYYAALAHEATRWTSHEAPLDRSFDQKRFGDEGYRGYLQDDIATAAGCCEPRRWQDLRILRAKVVASLRSDPAGCHRVVRELRRHRLEVTCEECHEVHAAVSLRQGHLFNDLAHLSWIDELLAIQLDLFAC